MAKKTRRPNLPQETLERARRELARNGNAAASAPAPRAETPQQPASSVAPTPARPTRAVSTEADLRSEYAYVIKDLEQMAMLAAALLVVLVLLAAFIIR